MTTCRVIQAFWNFVLSIVIKALCFFHSKYQNDGCHKLMDENSFIKLELDYQWISYLLG